jgi:hypothetical protein
MRDQYSEMSAAIHTCSEVGWRSRNALDPWRQDDKEINLAGEVVAKLDEDLMLLATMNVQHNLHSAQQGSAEQDNAGKPADGRDTAGRHHWTAMLSRSLLVHTSE